ncbi:phosphatase PAP2 family protein [Leucobacter sp. CSA1]|uniref:Phosphatase PAP2 family protein n=1 Tax=Leucobacter chromiisoli TaxID=2796471 RepID=A0A934UVK4_9MICO|nr:phosphatase PAP2 family protein [Leucobacter chromiisoli]MBK0419571.1 phosphatase PAP2 family protein [Leucobacter chromiisoli]
MSSRPPAGPPRSARAAALPGAAIGVATLALLAVVAFGVWLRFVDRAPLPVDLWWHDLLQLDRGTPAFAIAVFLADVGGGVGAAACTAIAAAALLALRRPRDAAAVATAMFAGVLCSELAKALIARPRPWDPLYHASGYSYPSGHSMGAAALALSVLLVVAGSGSVHRGVARAVGIAATCWILLMMWSRAALHVHWLTDTLAGALLGIAVAVLARRFWLAAPAGDVGGRA